MESSAYEYRLIEYKGFTNLQQVADQIYVEKGLLVYRLYGTYYEKDVLIPKMLVNDDDLQLMITNNIENLASWAIFYYTFVIDDCEILQEAGTTQFENVRIGDVLEKNWIVKGNFKKNPVCVECVEGEFKGRQFPGYKIDKKKYLFQVIINVDGNPRWSTSFWKVRISDVYIGPLLWIEANFNERLKSVDCAGNK